MNRILNHSLSCVNNDTGLESNSSDAKFESSLRFTRSSIDFNFNEIPNLIGQDDDNSDSSGSIVFQCSGRSEDNTKDSYEIAFENSKSSDSISRSASLSSIANEYVQAPWSSVSSGYQKGRKKHQLFPTEVVKQPSYLFIQMQLCRSETLDKWLQKNVKDRSFTKCYDIFNQVSQ